MKPREDNMRRISRTALALAAALAVSTTGWAAAPRTTSYGYLPNGLLEYVDGPLDGTGDRTTFTYDTSGNRATMTNAL